MFMFNLPFGPLTPNIVNGENLFAIKSSNVLFFFYLFQNLFLFVLFKTCRFYPLTFCERQRENSGIGYALLFL
jgi:hypothetical protein